MQRRLIFAFTSSHKTSIGGLSFNLNRDQLKNHCTAIKRHVTLLIRIKSQLKPRDWMTTSDDDVDEFLSKENFPKQDYIYLICVEMWRHILFNRFSLSLIKYL